VRLLVNEKKPADGKQFLAAAAGFTRLQRIAFQADSGRIRITHARASA
jgi:hypothetical protein